MKKIFLLLLLFSQVVLAQTKITLTVPPGPDAVNKNKLGQDLRLTNDSLKFRSWYNVKDYGIVGDGSTNDRATLQALINTLPEGATLYFPEGRYIFSASSGNEVVLLKKGQQYIGSGKGTVIKTTDNRALFYAGEDQDDVVIRNMRFVGSGKAANLSLQSLIMGFKTKRMVITDVWVDSCGGNGSNIYFGGAISISGTNNSTPFYQGATIHNVIGQENRVGLYLSSTGEYCRVTNIQMAQGITGIKLTAGNYSIIGGTVTGNTTGIAIDSSNNSAHAVVEGVLFNHNTTAFTTNKIKQGHAFIGCMFYYGGASITESIGIKFIGCDFYGGGTYTFTDSYLSLFSNSRIHASPANSPMVFTTVSGEAPIFSDFINVDQATDVNPPAYTGLKSKMQKNAWNIDSIIYDQLPSATDTAGFDVVGRNRTSGMLKKLRVDQLGIGGGMVNPMTTSQDIIVGGASGTPTRVGGGTNGQRLGISGGNIVWTDNDATWNGLFLQTLQTSSTSVTLSTHGLYTYVGSADATFTLPDLASNLNRMYFIKNSSAFNVTVQRAGSDNLFTTSSVTSIVIPAGSSRAIGGTTASGTSYWHVLGLPTSDFGGAAIHNYIASYNNQTGTTYTLLASDAGKILTFDNASDITLTVPTGLPVGFTCTIIQIGAGEVIFTASGTTINNRGAFDRTNGPEAIATITQRATNIFNTGGDMQ